MRKTMKKAITAGILSMAMIMSMAGCGSSDGKGEADTTGDVSETTYTIGISQSYISRLEKRIIKKLKKELESIIY